ncbi:MAG: carbon storage regulator CsrA [Candidatus Gastranaerophilales bacterium]|nr:carbon storage regulator CsrA [Candidatus Gastranaerophilales bacterium]
MLILTRKVNQKLIINDNIEVVILESYKNTVKIGVNAPSNVQIYREEVYNEIKKSNKQAHHVDIDAISNIKATKPTGTGFDMMNKIKKNDLTN